MTSIHLDLSEVMGEPAPMTPTVTAKCSRLTCGTWLLIDIATNIFGNPL